MKKNSYPKDLVERVQGNRDRQRDLDSERSILVEDLEKAESYLILSRGQLNWTEKLSGGVRKLLKKPTPGLEQMWDAKEQVSSLESAISSTYSQGNSLASNTSNAIRSYLMNDSSRYRELNRYSQVSYEALSSASSYLSLVGGTAHNVESLVRMVLRDWPDFRNPWRRRPQPPCPPVRPCPPRNPRPIRIMEEDDWDNEDWGDMPDLGVFGNLSDANLFTRELEDVVEESEEEISMDLYDPDVPDFSDVPDLYDPPRKPKQPKQCPRETWDEYWRNTMRRKWALDEARNGVDKVKRKKRGYVSAMRTYSTRRSPDVGQLPFNYDHALSGVQHSTIDELSWFNMLHPLLFLFNMERVGRQLRHLESYVAEVKPYINEDYSYYESEKGLMVSKVKQDILSD